MTVLVAMPYWGCPDELPTAVESVLGQTVRDLRLVVYADGCDVPDLPADPRLVVHRQAENRGPYFAEQAMLDASPYEWFAPHGADDWSDPDHLERLLAVGRDAVATGAVWFHRNAAAEPTIHRGTYEVGVFSRDRLRAFGGMNIAERMGQDTMTIHLLRLTGGLWATSEPTYHRVKAPGRLTTSAETGLGTPARNAMRARNRAALLQCRRLRRPALIARWRTDQRPPALAGALAREAAILREELG